MTKHIERAWGHLRQRRYWFDSAAIAVLVYIGTQMYHDWKNKPERFLIVTNTEVPDHAEGEDPTMYYGREIRQRFFGRWSVKIKAVGESGNTCQGAGEHLYEPNDSVGEVTLSWYINAPVGIGKKCHLPPGNYVMTTRWLTLSGAEIVHTSGVFKVHPEGWQKPKAD